MPTGMIRLRARRLLGCDLDCFDLRALQRRAGPAEKEALARRMFAVWRPLFAHLADKDYRFHLDKHVLDETPVAFGGAFLLGPDGSDRGLVLARLHEIEASGERVAHVTLNAGVRPEMRAENVTHLLALALALPYFARHPRRRLYFIDAPSSASSYRAIDKALLEVYPRPGAPIPDRLWPVARAAVERFGWAPAPDAGRGVYDVGCVVAASALTPRAERASRTARERAAWFDELTKGAPGRGVLVIAPVHANNVLGFTLSLARRLYARAASGPEAP